MPPAQPAQYRLVTTLNLQFDSDGLIASEALARLSVLRTLAREYNTRQLEILVFATVSGTSAALHNALLDLDTPSIRFARVPVSLHNLLPWPQTSLIDSQGVVVASWPSSADFNAATVGYAVRQQLGAPIYADIDSRP